MSEQLMPEVRFDEFDGDWNKGLLSDYLTVSMIANENLGFDRDEVYAVSLNDGVVNQIKFHGRSFAGRDLRNYAVALSQDIIYTKSPLSEAPFGIIKCNSGSPGIVSPLYAVYHPNDNASSAFVQTYFALNHRLNRYLRPLVNKGAKNTMNITDDYALSGAVIFPFVEEQQDIGCLFTALDAWIDQRRRGHQQLKQTKASLLKRMIPTPGESVPQIRFDGFKGEWSEHLLRELGVAKTGFGFPHEAQGGRTGMPFFKVSDMNLPQNSSTMQVANHYVTSRQVVRHRWKPIVDVPAILFAKVGAAVFVGRKRTVNVPFLMDNNMMAFCIDEESWDPAFARVVFDSLDLSQLAQVGALPSFNPPQVHDMMVRVPSTLAEQQAIGALFAKVDALIEAEQQRVEKLTQVKASLLRKMFV